LVGKEVFGSQKCKAAIPLGFDSKSHRPDKVNFSHPRIATRSARTNHASHSLDDVVEELSPNLQEDQASNNLGTMADVGSPLHVTAIQETVCKKTEWHIARLPKTSSKTSSNTCFAQQAITKKKCTAKIMQGNRSTAAPTYIGMIVHYKKEKEERTQFFFCNNDMEWHIKGTRRRWVQSRPNVLSIWPVKIGTNFSKKEILDLENVGFQLPQHAIISLWRLFRMEELPFDLSLYSTPASLDDHPKTLSCKNIGKNKNVPTTKYTNNCPSSRTMKGHLRQVTMIPHPRLGYIITLDFGIPPKVQQYMITIGPVSKCSCQYFKDMATKALGKRGQWANCKHLYFVFTVIGSLSSDRDAFIHAPSFSFNEVKQILESGIPANRIP
jgi:hypothetical protein